MLDELLKICDIWFAGDNVFGENNGLK